jgi:hypothetical protein
VIGIVKRSIEKILYLFDTPFKLLRNFVAKMFSLLNDSIMSWKLQQTSKWRHDVIAQEKNIRTPTYFD